MGRVYQLLAQWFLILFIVAPEFSQGQSQNNVLPIKGNFSGNFNGNHNGNGAGLSNIFSGTISVTNPLIASGFTNGVYPGGTMQLASLNGLWFWNASINAYTNSTNFYANFPSIAGSVFNVWGFTNSLFADTNTPNMFALGNTTPPTIPPQQNPGQMSDGTGTQGIGGQVQNTLVTNFLVANTLLQPAMSNQMHWVFPEQFGASGFGAPTNDSIPFQNAVNYCQGNNNFVLGCFPSNYYYFGTNTIVIANGISMWGNSVPERGGSGLTASVPTFLWTNGVTTGIQYGNGSEASGSLFNGLTFVGPGKNQTNQCFLMSRSGSGLVGQHINMNNINFWGWTTNVMASNVDNFFINVGWFHQCSNAIVLSGALAQSCVIQSFSGNVYGDGFIFDQGAIVTTRDCDVACNSGAPAIISRAVIARNGAQVVLDNQNMESGWPNILCDTGGIVDFRSGRCLGSYVMAILTNVANGKLTIRQNVILNADTNGVNVLVGNLMFPYNSLFSEQYLVVTNIGFTGTNVYANPFVSSSTNTLVVSATGVTNNTRQQYLLTITAGTGLSLKDINGTQFAVPVLGDTVPLKPGWGLTGTGVTAQCFQQ